MTPHGIIDIPSPHIPVAAALVKRVARHLENDNLAVLPTETRYALCALGTSPRAIENVRIAKGRSAAQPFSIFADSVRRLDEWKIDASRNARILMDAFWPGPLTLILPTTNRIFKHLGTAHSVGVRFSPAQLINQTVAQLGLPIVATSANPSGIEPDNRAENRWLTQLANGGTILWLRPFRYTRRPVSTVVDCTGRSIRILRAGAIPESKLRRVLNRGIS